MARLGKNKSGYEAMWLVAMFDLPVETKTDKRNYSRFRKKLLQTGFSQLQYSVYARHCASQQSADGVCKQVKAHIPSRGQVRLLMVTERQFGRMQVFEGEKRVKTEEPPLQYMLF